MSWPEAVVAIAENVGGAIALCAVCLLLAVLMGAI